MDERDVGNKRKNILNVYPLPPQTEDNTKEDAEDNAQSPPPKKQYPLNIAYKLPFIAFPIRDGHTSEDTARLTRLLDTRGGCNMGWLD